MEERSWNIRINTQRKRGSRGSAVGHSCKARPRQRAAPRWAAGPRCRRAGRDTRAARLGNAAGPGGGVDDAPHRPADRGLQRQEHRDHRQGRDAEHRLLRDAAKGAGADRRRQGARARDDALVEHQFRGAGIAGRFARADRRQRGGPGARQLQGRSAAARHDEQADGGPAAGLLVPRDVLQQRHHEAGGGRSRRTVQGLGLLQAARPEGQGRHRQSHPRPRQQRRLGSPEHHPVQRRPRSRRQLQAGLGQPRSGGRDGHHRRHQQGGPLSAVDDDGKQRRVHRRLAGDLDGQHRLARRTFQAGEVRSQDFAVPGLSRQAAQDVERRLVSRLLRPRQGAAAGGVGIPQVRRFEGGDGDLAEDRIPEFDQVRASGAAGPGIRVHPAQGRIDA